jgi:hypothetical protein
MTVQSRQNPVHSSGKVVQVSGKLVPLPSRRKLVHHRKLVQSHRKLVHSSGKVVQSSGELVPLRSRRNPALPLLMDGIEIG